MKVTRKIALVGFAAATMLGALASPASAGHDRLSQPDGPAKITQQRGGGRIIAQPHWSPTAGSSVVVTTEDADGNETDESIVDTGTSVREENCPKHVIC